MNKREGIVKLWFDMRLQKKDLGIEDIFSAGETAQGLDDPIPAPFLPSCKNEDILQAGRNSVWYNRHR